MPAYASIIIPTKNPGSRLSLVLNGIIKCRADFDYEVIIVDSGSTDNTKDAIKNFSVKLIEIPPHSFSHGGSRNIGAENAEGQILVFLSHDAIPADRMWLANLVKGFEERDVAGIFGRQIPDDGASAMEKFFLQYVYPDTRIVKDSINADNCTLQDMFFSNVNSAIRKSVWENNKFREDLIMSEDQAWAKDILTKKGKIIYEPKAAVYHSHNYSIKRAVMRNFDSGLSLKGLVNAPFKGRFFYELRYMKNAMLYFFKNRLYRYLFIFPFYESFKIFGFSLGRCSRFLPIWLKESVSENKAYWAQERKNVSRP